jgi:hypothetical protein
MISHVFDALSHFFLGDFSQGFVKRGNLCHQAVNVAYLGVAPGAELLEIPMNTYCIAFRCTIQNILQDVAHFVH